MPHVPGHLQTPPLGFGQQLQPQPAGFGQQLPAQQRLTGPGGSITRAQVEAGLLDTGVDTRGQGTIGQPDPRFQSDLPLINGSPQPIGPGGIPPQQFQQGLPPGVPQTGLIGAEQALAGGLQGSLGALGRFGQAGFNQLTDAQARANQLFGQARGDVAGAFGQGQAALQQAQGQGLGAITEAIGQGVQPLTGFAQGGQGAFDIQNALAGGLGPEAQRQALANLQPVNQFLQEQGQRQIGSAVGRRGFSGDAIREAARFGQGLAGQSLADQFGRLATTSGQGLQASGQIGQLRGQQAGLASNLIGNLGQARGSLFGQQGGLLGNLGQAQAGQAFNFGQAGQQALQNLGINQANLIGGVAGQVAGGRTGFGTNLANALGGGAANLANLQSAGGAGLSDILGGAGINAANLQTGFGNLSAADQQQLATILANISTGQGSQLANVPQQQFNTLGQIGQLASGVGGALAGFENFQNRNQGGLTQQQQQAIASGPNPILA